MIVSTAVVLALRPIRKPSQMWYTWLCSNLRTYYPFLQWSSVSILACRQYNGGPPSVHVAATLFETICYSNKDALSAGIIVAGWDKEVGPSVYNIPLGGGLFRQPWAIGGSGSTYVYGYCDATYKEGWGRDETVQFVKNSKPSVPN